jgi:hypothetical protein
LIFDCREGIFDPLKVWVSTWGRIWVGPLRNVGPIEVSIQARRYEDDPVLPLFIEIRSDALAAECRSAQGAVYWQTYGTKSCDPDSMWITFPRTELAIPLGTTYWVQLTGFLQVRPIWASSPFWRCLQVRAFPDAVVPGTWGHVKTLYKDAAK